MQSSVKKLYHNSLEKRNLFNFLLERLPKETLYSFSKKDLKFKREAQAREAIAKAKYLYYNKNLTTELIFDIDKISHTTAWDLEWIFKVFLDKTGIIPSWICYTNNGIQFCVSLNTFYKLSKKQKKILRDFKEYIINSWELIDGAGSKRLKGWWRNPLTQKDFIFTGWVTTFQEIKDFLSRHNRTIQEQFKTATIKNSIKTNIQAIREKKFFIAGEPAKGNRNNWLWHNTMLYTNSKNFDEVLEVTKELNKKIRKELEEKELIKIAKSVTKYNNGFNRGNEIYGWNVKASWNIGSMKFEKIRNLSYEEYKKEVKRRQKMAGKRTGNTIGKEVLIKANKKKAEATKAKVYKAIKKLKEKGEKVTIMKVKELANVSYASAQKYVKQAKEEGII